MLKIYIPNASTKKLQQKKGWSK